MTLARLVRPAAPLLILAAFALPPVSAAEKWDPKRTTAPETVEELQALQDAVKRVVEKCTPCTVGLMVASKDGKGFNAGSGIIVSEDGLILTVGHVIGKPGQDCQVIFPDGKRVEGKTLGSNEKLDTGMAKITEKGPDDGKWPCLPLGKGAALKKGQWVVTLGHPGGFKSGRPPVARLGQVLDTDEHIIRTSCTLVGGDSGGPLFDLEGNVVGIHDRIGFTLSSNIHLPVESYLGQWDRLVKGEAIDGKKKEEPTRGTAALGVQFDDSKEGGAWLMDVVEDGPAEKAGLRAGDMITKFDGVKVASPDDVRALLKTKKPGEDVDVTLKRGSKTLEKTVTLGKRDT